MEWHGYAVVSARLVLRQLAGRPLESRFDLQEFGAQVESRTGGTWLAQAACDVSRRESAPVVVDAVRTADQVAAFREMLTQPSILLYLAASQSERRIRFSGRVERDLVEAGTLEMVDDDDVERGVAGLVGLADDVLDTESSSAADVAEQASTVLRTYRPTSDP